MTQPTYVIGHTQPDTDAICSAVAYARLKATEDSAVTAARTGPLNPETTFVLDRWDVEAPTLLEDATDEQLILVDHNEHSQTVDGAREATITEIVDHHRLGDVTTSEPIFCLIEPVGSTATILYGLSEQRDIELDSQTAGLLLSGLVSDTVVLRSPTTTERDRVVAEQLAEIADVDIEAYGTELLTQKSKLGEKSPREMVLGDFKEFAFGERSVGIGQIETVGPAAVLDQRDAIGEAMAEIVDERAYDVLVLLVTDLLEEASTAFVVGEESDRVGSALDVEITDGEAFLPGVMSRKKQVVPPLESAFR